jgi:hypothetical protein
MRAVVSAIGDARPSCVQEGRGLQPGQRAAHVTPRLSTGTPVCRGRGSPCERWRRVRTLAR